MIATRVVGALGNSAGRAGNWSWNLTRRLISPRIVKSGANFTRLIGQNRLVVGDSLPSTREIARDFGISRLTVLKAFQAMERAGIVGVRPGRGYFVKHRQSEADGENRRIWLVRPLIFVSPSRNRIRKRSGLRAKCLCHLRQDIRACASCR